MTFAIPRNASLDALSRAVAGRQVPLFQEDLDNHAAALAAAAEGRRILVVGGAGSLGSSTVYQLLRFSPRHLCLLDTSENNLVEVLRSIRSARGLARAEVAIQPLDYGSGAAERFLAEQEPFDLVLNFSALKHVRSERDAISLLQLLDTNLVRADRFLGWLRRHGHGRQGVFFVSSDKAANPANLMGASKRAMEQMLHWHSQPSSQGRTLAGPDPRVGGPLPRVTTARFANVAFSDGSLPHGFLQRLAKGQPLSGPSDVRRFLLTLEEAGQLCLLAALHAEPGHLLAPRLDPEADMVGFRDIAAATLAHHGFQPRWCASEEEAREAEPGLGGLWPCHFAPSDTMGEKLFEEFVGSGECALEAGYRHLIAVAIQPGCLPDILEGAFQAFGAWLRDASRPLSKANLIDTLARVVPTLQHETSERSLDAKM